MYKYFNTAGVCIKDLHYMVNIDDKLKQITKLINRNNYFVINRPRQYGKTTTLHSLELQYPQKAEMLYDLSKNIENLKDLSKAITNFIKASDKEVVLFIDEVDKSSNNQIFVSFLGMLRNKYLAKMIGKDYTFKSVVLAGVHDIKNLKLKVRDGQEMKLNPPWNIAVNFDIDMSFDKNEIATMLEEYNKINNLESNVDKLADKIHYYTGGYPFLVSRICQIIDEKFMEEDKENWRVDDIDKAVKSIFKEYDNRVAINNRLYEQIIYNYMISKMETNQYIK